MLQIQQQTIKDQKKVTQARNKYEKELAKFEKTKPIEKFVEKKKDLDSWLHEQVEHTSTQIESQSEDDDEIQFKTLKDGPFMNIPRRNTEAYHIARTLIDDDNLSVCRDTGVMKRRNRSRSPRSNSSYGSSTRSTREAPPRRESRRARYDEDQGRARHDTPLSHGRAKPRANRYNKEEPWSKELRRALTPPGSGKDRSWFSDSSDSVASEHKACPVRSKIKSGINAKPCSKVKRELIYPHFSLGQTSGFMSSPLQFHQLSYEQFIAGELNTIMNVTNSDERKGRVALLQKIANWKLLANVNWQQIRNTYAHILRKIENKEMGWCSDYDRFERHIYETIASKIDKNEKIDKIEKSKIKSKQTGFANNTKELKGAVWSLLIMSDTATK